MANLSSAIERLYDLHVGVTSAEDGEPHERPHKPLLLLAALDLIEEGEATPDRIPWCQSLRDRFTARFEIVRKHNDQNTPDNPFFYLRKDGFWNAWEECSGADTPLGGTPAVGQFGRVFARLSDSFEILAADPASRRMIREALVARYFPRHGNLLLQPGAPAPEESAGDAEESEGGRSPGFRKKILEIYDHQCAACGLRIRLPQARDISFIDAAHLIPFSESRNDHPTNGLALCKNHHWAMDRNMIAPGTDLRWHVSAILEPHRSSGEKELMELADRAILLPHEPAFQPDPGGLAWRMGRLIA